MAISTGMQYFLDLISIFTIGMCFVQKIPQIMNLAKVKSVQGLSMLSLFLELTSYTVMTSYNFTNGYSLLSYMEYPVLLSQQYIILFLVFKYMGAINKRTVVFTILYFVLFILFLKQIVPKYVLTFMAPLCTPISASGKIAQLSLILRARNADSVSILTWFISTLTNITRLFTIWINSGDAILLTNFIISATLSSSVMISVIYFKNLKKKE